MKYPTPLQTLTALALGSFFIMLSATTAEARIGERRESIERRLFDSGGIVYRDDAIEAQRRRGMPYLKYMEYLPSSSDVRIYFKTADGRRPTSSELEANRVSAGWDLHVVYINGKSAIEVYKRSQGMSEFEMNHLLALHTEGGYWKRPTKEEMQAAVTAFGFQMIRSDGAVRAKKLGHDSLMFIDPEVDIRLAEMNRSHLNEAAPISVDGF